MVEKIVAILNEAAALDHVAVRLLVLHRQACSDELANHPPIVTGDVRGFGQGGRLGGLKASIGMIGLLDALEPGKKRIAVVIDDVNPMTPVRFEVATPKTHPALFNGSAD